MDPLKEIEVRKDTSVIGLTISKKENCTFRHILTNILHVKYKTNY